MKRTTKAFSGETIEIKPGLRGDAPIVLGALDHYDNGQARVEFTRGGARDWYVWSVKRQQRLAEYGTRRELEDAFRASDNTEGAYGCASLSL